MRTPFLALTLVAIAACGSDSSDWDPDAAVIDQLSAAGSDISKPHTIEFFTYFPAEDTAKTACGSLADNGFSVAVHFNALTDEYLCFATMEVVPTLEEMHRLRSELETLASELGGEYDGWGTPVVE